MGDRIWCAGRDGCHMLQLSNLLICDHQLSVAPKGVALTAHWSLMPTPGSIGTLDNSMPVSIKISIDLTH